MDVWPDVLANAPSTGSDPTHQAPFSAPLVPMTQAEHLVPTQGKL